MEGGGTQPNILREQGKKPSDLHVTTERQSERGSYEDKGGDRFKRVLISVVVFIVVALIVTLIVDLATGVGFISE